MRRRTKIMLAAIGFPLGVMVAGASYFAIRFPDGGPVREIRVEVTSERIKRGEYLANHVLGCIDCHSIRDWRYFAGPVVPGTEGKGGDEFGPEMGLPGRFYGSNITPSGIGDWSDGELFRAIASGVNKKGEALFPIMPYLAYNQMPEEEIYAVIAYIRTLKPIESHIASRRIDFPVSILVRTMPIRYRPGKLPADSDAVAYGKYVTALAGCAGCHTPTEKGKPVKGMNFAGGSEFVLPNGQRMRASNITPDLETGIGLWSREDFLEKFKLSAAEAANHVLLPENSVNTVMPWTPEAGMQERELGAIYAYLRTVIAVRHQVDVFPAMK